MANEMRERTQVAKCTKVRCIFRDAMRFDVGIGQRESTHGIALTMAWSAAVICTMVEAPGLA